ncbi:MAG: right-handed parallel beta-helix repeat-containing protein, partial [Cyanobacteria bacterium J06614_10]
MSMPDWESLQVKVVRALFLAVSSVFVVFYGFSAFASEYDTKKIAEEASVSAKVITAKSLAKTVLPQQTAPIPASESGVALASTISLSNAVSSPVVSAPEATAAPVQLSRIDRQHTPAVDINVAPAEPNVSADADSSTSIPVEHACDDDRLDIPTRFGASYNTSSAGFDDIIGVNTFIPLSQDECEDVTFFEGRAMLSDGEPSFSLNVGHRDYDAEDNIINGGYLGVDSRATDSNTFYQLAAGYERIQDNWELRLNGYLPLGDQTNTLQSVVDDSAVQTASGFEANQLVLSAVGERQRILQQENALGGFDVEVGGQLDEWYGGELRGYAGAYLLSGEDSGLGVQARILADFESSFNAGLSVQHDGIFGTSVGFSIGASLPGIRFHDEGERTFQEENEVVIRLRDPLVRRPTVAVNVIDESEIVAVDEREALRNPEEEQDYRFVHVDLAQGAGAGDGTFENPFGAVEDAIALINTDTDTYSDGNTIVYVDGENAPTTTIPGFAIPDRVRVLSQGPAQTIAGMDFPGFPSTATRLPFSAEQNFNVESDAPNANGITVELPDSNDGVFPTITGGGNADLVTLGENTVLAGFEIRDAANHGVTAANINNVELRNNLIENSGGSGVSLDNVGGSVVLFDNEINGSGDRGIQIQNSVTEQSVEVAIAGFDLDNNQVGMEFLAMASDTEFPSQRITIGPSSEANTSVGTPNGTPLTNSILNSAEEGIIAEATGSTTSLASAATQELEVSDTTIDNSGADGIRLLTRDGSSSQEFTFTRGTVSD